MFKFIRYITSRRKLYYLIALGYLAIALGLLDIESHEKKNIIPKLGGYISFGWKFTTTIKLLPGTKLTDGFDDNFDTLFHSSSGEARGSVTIESPYEQIINGFKISPQTNLTSRCPTNIILDASNNGKDWATLGRFNNITFNGLTAGQFKNFEIETSNNYKIFRFDFNGRDEYLTFSELQIISQRNHVNYFIYFWLICMFILLVVIIDQFLYVNDK